MKKAIILVFFIFAIILTGCDTDENSSQSEKIVQQEFAFKKNQECLKFKDKLEIKLNSKDSPFGETSLEQIFYSPKVNSCLYVEYGDQGASWNRRLLDITNDGPSSNPLDVCLDAKTPYDCDEFDKKLEDYKTFE